MSDISDALPAVAAIDAKIQAERERESEVTERIRERGQKYHREHARWTERAIEAELDGKQPPKEPQPPDTVRSNMAVERIRATIDALIRDRFHAIVDGADVVHEQATAEVEAALADAYPHVEALQTLLPRVRAATSAVDSVADARQQTSAHRTVTRRTVSSVDLGALLAAVSGGADVLLDNRDPRPPRPLGFTAREGMDEPQTDTDAPTGSVTESPGPDQSVTVRSTNRGATP
ncbi:hypothetical protein ACHAAC_16105 [Aeromicrobium sp. CF4.19]|uniref:hypothetical protein n=1 Tax=Aeromicrobium sp. CF4.19 TaxID=3373082 RepID=UPI003EE64189